MKTPSTCDQDSIVRFLDERLSPEEAAQLETHLEHCDRCSQTLLMHAAEDRFWQETKTFLAGVDLDEGREFLDRSTSDRSPTEAAHWSVLSMLDPTDDPDMLGRFAGYEVTGVIGYGGMGVVMKARDVSLDRFVAIKVLHPNFACLSAARQRFAREAQAAAAVVHDNVVGIYGVDQWKQTPYLVMPYLKGESLQQRIDHQAPLQLEDMLRIALQTARGLAAAHEQGLVHRDIKPANILMPAGVSRIMITDFGLARTADDIGLTCSGMLAGTPPYMSPEQVRGEALDGRSDLFSLGCVLYAMSVGQSPFASKSPYGALRKVTDQPHQPLQKHRHELPDWFCATVDRLLEKQPTDRYETAQHLATHLEECLTLYRQGAGDQLSKRLAKQRAWSLQNIQTPRLLIGAAVMGVLLVSLAFGISTGLFSWPIASNSDTTAGQALTGLPAEPDSSQANVEPSESNPNDSGNSSSERTESERTESVPGLGLPPTGSVASFDQTKSGTSHPMHVPPHAFQVPWQVDDLQLQELEMEIDLLLIETAETTLDSSREP